MTDTAARTLEERVAALEECLAHPLMSVEMHAPEMTEHQAAELRQELEKTLRDSARAYKVLPARPLLTPETARALLRECVTVVKPGEVLVMAMPEWMTPNQAREVYDVVRYWCEAEGLDLKVLVVPSCEFAVLKADAG